MLSVAKNKVNGHKMKMLFSGEFFFLGGDDGTERGEDRERCGSTYTEFQEKY